MKLVPVNEHDFNFKKTSNLAVIEEFLNSGHECVMIQDHGHANTRSAQSCLATSIKRFGY